MLLKRIHIASGATGGSGVLVYSGSCGVCMKEGGSVFVFVVGSGGGGCKIVSR